MGRNTVPGRGRVYADDQNRQRIAAVAARLIVEHGMTDWSQAKRKAARQLMLSPREGLPGDDEVEAALAEHQAIFGGEEQAQTLREQREEALAWMQRLGEFRPLLVGAVAAGWAGEYSDIRIELTADDPKAVELMLINADVRYGVAPASNADAPPQLMIDTPAGSVRLIVRDPREARQRPRREGEARMDAVALARVLGETRG
jgi:hypothetical protein